MSAWDDPAFRAMLEEADISVTVRTWFECEPGCDGKCAQDECVCPATDPIR